MKTRLLVMNNTRVLQSEGKPGAWETQKVFQGDQGLKPGFYNLHAAQKAAAGVPTTGLVLHQDKDAVYQQVGKDAYVVHNAQDLADQKLQVGKSYTIDGGQATLSQGQSNARSMKI